MVDVDLELCMLHHRPDLLQDTAVLLNQEWSRSLTARIQSIAESRDELPCSLLLITAGDDREKGEKVVGHARLLQVAGCRDAALVESVVVLAEMRRRGLGRRLVESCEQHARKLGCVTMHLSTHDQHKFYQKLGYTVSTPVNGLRKCTSKLLSEQSALQPVFLVQSSTDAAHAESFGSDEASTTSCTPSPSSPPPPPPPPAPPPPPPPPPPPTINEANGILWYAKNLVN